MRKSRTWHVIGSTRLERVIQKKNEEEEGEGEARASSCKEHHSAELKDQFESDCGCKNGAQDCNNKLCRIRLANCFGRLQSLNALVAA